MNIGNISNISIPKTFLNKNVLSPAFKSQPSKDTFVKSADAVRSVDLNKTESSCPEYLYHLTSIDNYQKIMESGKIKQAQEAMDGVFMFDMPDFQNNWRNNSYLKNGGTVAKGLFAQAVKSGRGVIMLKIPTKSLDKDSIRIRPVEDMVKMLHSDKFRNISIAYGERGGPFCESAKYEYPKNITEGYPVSDAKSYTEKGIPVEYIYRGDIDIKDAQVVKVFESMDLDYSNVMNSSDEDLDKLYKDIQLASEEN